jgi:hypothetical protein
MITLNTNKSIVRLDGWDDLIGRPGFSTNLDPAEHDLDAIIGRYNISDRVRCGLSNCHTLHAKGYLVSTKSGRETNIGKDCGKTYFGADFEILAKQFERMSKEQDNRAFLSNFSFNVEELDNNLQALRGGQRGADWVYKHSRCLIDPNSRVPVEVVRAITKLVKTKSNGFSVQREATEKEAETMEVLQGRPLSRPQYVDEVVAVIRGLEVLYGENDLRQLLVIDVEELLKKFRTLAIDELTFEQLAFWRKWAVSVERSLETAKLAISYGQSLLTRDNLAPLLLLPSLERGAERALFQEYLAAITA